MHQNLSPTAKTLHATGRRKGPLLLLAFSFVSYATAADGSQFQDVIAEETDKRGVDGLRGLYSEVVVPDKLKVTIGGSKVRLEEEPLYFSQSLEVELGAASHEISFNESTLKLEGDSLVAYSLPDVYRVEDNTILKFDFSLVNEESIHAICARYVKDSLYVNGKIALNRCFLLAGTHMDAEKTFSGMGFRMTATPEGQTRTYELQVGHFFQHRIRYLFFINNSFGNKGRGEVIYKNIELFDDPDPTRLVVNIAGSSTVIDKAPLQYGYPGLDRNGVNSYKISKNGGKVTLRGNAWKAFPIYEYTVVKNTVLEFDFTLITEVNLHAICLVDAVDVPTFEGRGCFRLAGNVDEDFDGVSLDQTSEGETKSYKVKVGQFFQRDVNFFLFISSAPKEVGRHLGLSSFESIKLYDEITTLVVNVNAVNQYVAESYPYGLVSQGRNIDGSFSLSDAGAKLTLEGDVSRAFPIAQQQIVDNTVLEFYFTVSTEAEAHAICLDSTITTGEDELSDRCFLLGGSAAVTNGNNSGQWRYILKRTEEGQRKLYRIEVGHFFLGRIEYISFLSLTADGESGDAGKVSFEDVKLFERKLAPRLKVALGSNIKELGRPVSYGDASRFEDLSGQNQYKLASDGGKITLRGNAWKAFPISYNVRRNTILEFDFTLTEKSNYHAICLDNDLDHTYLLDSSTVGLVETESRLVDRCFLLAGKEACDTKRIHDGSGNKKVQNLCWSFHGAKTLQDEGSHAVRYHIDVGNYFTGKVTYLALVTDGPRSKGEASFEYIEIFNH